MANLDDCMGPLWKPKLWEEINKEEYIKYSNCYTYAFNYVDYGNSKLQPGEIHGTKYRETSCDEIINKIKNDYLDDNIKKIKFDEKLPKDRYRIALFIDPDENRKGTKEHDQDYHFYRQDCNGTWSHKPGTNKVTNEDASGNAIIDPKKADRDYQKKCKRENGDDCDDEHNYSEFCAYLSVPLNSLHGPIIRYIEREEDDNDNNNNNEKNEKKNEKNNK